MPKTSEAAKEARRTQILDAAVRCFARTGYYATTIEDVVRETDLSRGALYLYFPSKEALYLAISDRWNCGMEAAIKARLTPDLTPAATLRVLIEGWNLSQHIPVLAERARQRQARSVSALSQLLQAGIAAGEFRADIEVEAQARILMATLHGLMVQWHRQPGSIDWHSIAEEIVRGLRAVTL